MKEIIVRVSINQMCCISGWLKHLSLAAIEVLRSVYRTKHANLLVAIRIVLNQLCNIHTMCPVHYEVVNR